MKNAVFVLLLLISASATGQVEQLTSIQSSGASSDADPASFTPFGDKVLFTATTPAYGLELWITDGTSQGTHLVKDLSIGPVGTTYTDIVVMKDKAYFVASTFTGEQLWMSDGTAAGTTQVSNIIFHNVTSITTDGTSIYFSNSLNSSENDLWKSDGTSGGTVLVKKITDVVSDLINLTTADTQNGPLLFFTAQPSVDSNSKVWRSDGTENGTFTVSDEIGGAGMFPGFKIQPSNFINYHNNVYFIGRDQTKSPAVGIWKSDGITSTYMQGIFDGDGGNGFPATNAIIHNDKMYFSICTGFSISVWESDGVDFRMIYSETFPDYFSPSNLFARDNYLYLNTGDQSKGTILAKLSIADGSIESLKQLGNNFHQPEFLDPDDNLTEIDGPSTGNFYIAQFSLPSFKKLWTSDGTVEGTAQLTNTTIVEDMIVLKDQLLFAGSVQQLELDIELWSSSGTNESTKVLKAINSPSIGIDQKPLTVVGAKALWQSGIILTVNEGEEPWVTDGTATGTKVLKDIHPGGSQPHAFVTWNNKIAFIAFNDKNGYSVYTSDGTADGTKELVSLPAGYFPERLFPSGEKLFIISLVQGNDNPYSIDVVKVGDSNITPIKKAGPGQYVFQVAVAGSNLFFILQDFITSDLWKSDGTASGTVPLAHYDATMESMTSVGTSIYFVAFGTFELYKSDGTSTTLITTLPSEPSGLTAFNDKLAFNVMDENGNEAWISDGTTVGTKMIADINPGAANGVINFNSKFTVIDNKIYFAANNGVNGFELYESDGTAANTVMVKDINPGSEGSNPSSITSINNQLYFSAYQPSSGNELWTSDGTDGGTKLLVDIIPGSGYSNVSNIVSVGGRLVFYGLTSSDGTQLLAYTDGTVTGLEEESSSFVIYPNPSTGIFQLNAASFDSGNIEIYSADGRCIGKSIYSGPGHPIDLRHSANGIYFVRFFNNGKSHTLKVVKN